MPAITKDGMSGEIPRRRAQRTASVTKTANVAREPSTSTGAGPSMMPNAYEGLRLAATLESTCIAATFDHWSMATIAPVNSTYGCASAFLTLDASGIGPPNLSSNDFLAAARPQRI